MPEPIKIKLSYTLEELEWLHDAIVLAPASQYTQEKLKGPILARVKRAMEMLEEEERKRATTAKNN